MFNHANYHFLYIICRDWRGLAELIGLTSESITFLQSRSDPTSEILKMWSSNSSSSSTSTIIKSKSIAELKTFLCVIDRFDIVDDVQQCLGKNKKAWMKILSILGCI